MADYLLPDTPPTRTRCRDATTRARGLRARAGFGRGELPGGSRGVFLIPFDDFMRRAGARPNTEEDPRVKRYDNRCVALASGGSSSALVVCHIAYPRILFTDVLTLLEFADEPGGAEVEDRVQELRLGQVSEG